MSFFTTCVYLRRNLPAVWPPNASLYASSTCVHLRLLAGPFGQGFTRVRNNLCMINPRQILTDSQVVASSGTLNLRRDLRWVAKRTGKFPHKYTIQYKPISRQTFPIFHWLMMANGRQSTCIDLAWVAKRWKTCVDLRANLILTKVSASHCKSTQANARPGQTKSQVDPSFQLASACDSVWPGLKLWTATFTQHEN